MLDQLVGRDRCAAVQVRLGRSKARCGRNDPVPAAVEVSAGVVRLAWPGVGRFRVRQGRDVLIHPAGDADEQVLRLFLLGPVLAVLLHQRGRLVLHASGVALDGCAVAFLGGSGWGKSTLAGLLHRRGHRFLTDDVLPVDVERGRTVAPGIPELKV